MTAVVNALLQRLQLKSEHRNGFDKSLTIFFAITFEISIANDVNLMKHMKNVHNEECDSVLGV